MNQQDKQKLTESDICDLFITAAIKQAGWDQTRQIRREFALTPGPVVVRGNMSSRNKKRAKRADYMLQWESGIPIAIVEAKDNTHSVGHGMQQALGYAEILDVPSAFSSNGDASPRTTRCQKLGLRSRQSLHSKPSRLRLNSGSDTRRTEISTRTKRNWSSSPTTKTQAEKHRATTKQKQSTGLLKGLPKAKSACFW